MHTAELIRWAAVAAITATFWSLGARRPLVLARAAMAHGRFRSAAD